MISKYTLHYLGAILAILALFAPAISFGQVNSYSGSGNYETLSNWSLNSVPSGAEQAHIISGTQTVTYDGPTDYTTTGRMLAGLGGTSNGTLIMDGSAGTLTFGGDDGAAAIYFGVDGGTGTLTINAGTYETTGVASLRLGSNGAGSTGFLNVNSGGTLQNAYRTYVGSGTGNNGTMIVNGGTVNTGATNGGGILVGNNGANGSMSVTNGGTVSVRGSVSVGTVGAGGTGSIFVDGAGSLLDQNTGGSILLGGSSATNTGNLTVTDGGSVTALNLGINGAGGAGTITFDGTGTLSSTNEIRLQGSAPGSGFQADTGAGTFDLTITDSSFNTITTGTLLLNAPVGDNINLWNPSSIGGSQLEVDVAGIGPGMGDSFDVISYTAITGAQFEQGTSITTPGGYEFAIDYGTGSNDNITLTVTQVPEPSTFAFLAGVLVLGTALYRRSKKNNIA